MVTVSVWEGTRTFFPLFLSMLEARNIATACVVGASDGKFVLPLARRGIRVVAIECDPLALDGGAVVLPGKGEATIAGLRRRLTDEGLTDQVHIIEADVLETVDVDPTGAVWTSCSWHYSINRRRPLGDFIETAVRQGATALGLNLEHASYGSVDEVYLAVLDRDILAEEALTFA